MSALRRLPLLLLLAGCAGSGLAGDPIDRPGTWAPQGDNAANLRAMVADPRDLVAGRGEADGLAAEAAPAAGLLLSGRRYYTFQTHPQPVGSCMSVSGGLEGGEGGCGGS